MGTLANTFSTIKYWLSAKSEPVFNDYSKIILDFSTLSPKTRDPYNLSGGLEHYESGPTTNGIFTCQRMTQEEIDECYNNYIASYPPGEAPSIREKWKYKSTACNSYDKFRIDIWKPGRIVVCCNIPKYGCAAPWLFLSMNEGDFTNPYLLPIDKPDQPRNYYFEIDLLETFFEKCKQRLSFTGHYGTQDNRKMKTRSITGNFDNGFHYPEVVWDGKGNWTFLLDSVVIHKEYIPQPEDIYPYFLLTLGVFIDYDIPADIDEVTWKVNYVKFSNNIINL